MFVTERVHRRNLSHHIVESSQENAQVELLLHSLSVLVRPFVQEINLYFVSRSQIVYYSKKSGIFFLVQETNWGFTGKVFG